MLLKDHFKKMLVTLGWFGTGAFGQAIFAKSLSEEGAA